jgi:hypothetical protein
MDFIQPQKVSVSFVDNRKTAYFVWDDIHDVDIVHNGIDDIPKAGYGNFDII